MRIRSLIEFRGVPKASSSELFEDAVSLGDEAE
jgi:hypothetical protein